MASRESSEQDEKPASRSRKTSKCWFKIKNCFSQSSFSDSGLDSDSEYVVINHSVFKIPKSIQANDTNLNPVSVGSSNEQRTVVVQRGSEKKVSSSYNRKPVKRTTPVKRVGDKKTTGTERRNEPHSTKEDLEEKIYQYIRMKTYERMNPYEMSPNDFLNNISSVFVDNLKDPIPKDPTNRPRIFNRYGRKKKKTETQLMYEKAMREKQISGSRPVPKRSEIQSLRKPTINPAVMSELNKSYGEDSLGYKAAIEEEGKGKEYEEKVLIWKIVVGNEEGESKE